MKVKYYTTQLKMKGNFTIAYGNYTQRNALVVALSHWDKTGYGECVEIDYYGIHLEDLQKQLSAIQTEIEEKNIVNPTIFYSFLASKNLHPFLLSALDCAYWDLFGKLENQSFASINGISNEIKVESSITISVAPIEEQIQKIKESNWHKFKIKCNGFHAENLEKLIETEIDFALDANASFTEKDCIALQENEISKKILYIEQPLSIGNYKILNKNKFAHWMADEDAQNIDILDELSPHYNSINIKLMKCGGLTPALELIQKAKQMGFKIMLGCMTESSIGISAACALAPLLDFADLDGANLIANDYAKGSFVENGTIFLSEKPGLGISLIE